MAKQQGWFALIAEEVRGIKDDPRSLRKFGLTMGICLAVLGGLFLWRDRAVGPYFLVAGAIFLLFALAAPRALRQVQKVWMTFAIMLGWLMTRVLLVLVFFIGVTPIALIAKISGKRFLELQFEPDKQSYWEKREKPTMGRERYERQF